MNKEITYRPKYNKHIKEEFTEYRFIEFFEDLNENEWYDFIFDLLLERIDLSIKRNFHKELDLFESISIYFDKLNLACRRLIKRSIKRIIVDKIDDELVEGSKESLILNNLLYLSQNMEWGIDKEVLAYYFVVNKNLPIDIRILAANTLAVHEDKINPNFWINEVDNEEDDRFIVAKIHGLKDTLPEIALELYRKVDFEKEEMLVTRYYMLSAIQNLVTTSDGIQKLINIIMQYPDYVKQNLLDIIKESDQGLYFRLSSLEVSDIKVTHKNSEQITTELPLKTEYLIDTPIPDQKILKYAYVKGFFKYLNITPEVMFEPNYEEIPRKYVTNGSTLGKNIFSLPRQLIKEPFMNASTDLAIINRFDGFSLYTNDNDLRKFDDKVERFEETMHKLYNAQIEILDTGARDYFGFIEVFFSHYFPKVSGLIHKYMHSTEKEMIDAIINASDVVYVLPTASIKASLIKMGFYDLFSPMDFVNLIDIKCSHNEKSNWMKRLKRHYLHNCWNINIPIPDNNENESYSNEEKSTIYRLSSVAYYTIDYIEKNEDNYNDFVKFLTAEWAKEYEKGLRKIMLSEDNIKEACKSSYRFFTFENADTILFNDMEESYYGNTISSSVKFGFTEESRKIIQKSEEFYKNLNIYKKTYQSNIKEILNLTRNRNTNIENYEKAISCYISAQSHADRFNFYDAQTDSKKALAIIKES